MYVVQYLSLLSNNSNSIIEEAGPPPQQPQDAAPDQDPNAAVPDPSATGGDGSMVEFENIKKFLLYGKLKELKASLENSDYYNKNDDLIKLKEFLDIIILFFNTFKYNELLLFCNDISDTIDQKINLTPKFKRKKKK